MLRNIRLPAAGQLPPGYHLGPAGWTRFGARCTRFLVGDEQDVHDHGRFWTKCARFTHARRNRRGFQLGRGMGGGAMETSTLSSPQLSSSVPLPSKRLLVKLSVSVGSEWAKVKSR